MPKGSYTIAGPDGSQVSFDWDQERDPSQEEMGAILSHALKGSAMPPPPMQGLDAEKGRAGPNQEGGYDPSGSSLPLWAKGMDAFHTVTQEWPATVLGYGAENLAPMFETKDETAKREAQEKLQGGPGGMIKGPRLGADGNLMQPEGVADQVHEALKLTPQSYMGDVAKPIAETTITMAADPSIYVALDAGGAAIRKGAAALFGGQAAVGGVQALGHAYDSVKNQDYHGALQELTQAGVDAGMAVLMISHMRQGTTPKEILDNPAVYGPARPETMQGPPAPPEFPSPTRTQTASGAISADPGAKGQIMMPFEAFDKAPEPTPPSRGTIESQFPSRGSVDALTPAEVISKGKGTLENQLEQTRNNRKLGFEDLGDLAGLGGPEGIEGGFSALDRGKTTLTLEDLAALDPKASEKGSTPIFSDIAKGILKLVQGDEGVVEIGGKKGGRAFHGTQNDFHYFNLEETASKGAGGDTFGRGVYLTDKPEIAAGFGEKIRNQILPKGTKLLNLAAEGPETLRTLSKHLETKLPGLTQQLLLDAFPGHWDAAKTPAERYELLTKSIGDYLKMNDPELKAAIKEHRETPMPPYEPGKFIGPEDELASATGARPDSGWWDHLANWRTEHPALNEPREAFGGKSVNEVVQEKSQDLDLYIGKLLEKSGVHGLFYKANQTMKVGGLPEGNNVVLFSDDLINSARRPGGHLDRLYAAMKAGDITKSEWRAEVQKQNTIDKMGQKMTPVPGTPEFDQWMKNPERGAISFQKGKPGKEKPMSPGMKKAFEIRESLLLAPKILGTKMGSDSAQMIEHPILRGISAGLENTRATQAFEKASGSIYQAVAKAIGRPNDMKDPVFRATVERHFSDVPQHLQSFLDTNNISKLGDAMVKGWKEAPFELNPHSRMTRDIGGEGGKILRTVPRAMGAITNVASQVAASSELRAIANREAISQGLKGSERKAYIQKMADTSFGELPKTIQDKLVKVGQEKTLLDNLGSIATRINAMRLSTGAVGRFISPFFQIRSNIIKGTYQRTPLVLPELAVKAAKGELKGGDLSDELAKSVFGSGVGIAILMTGKKILDTLEGSGPLGVGRELNREMTRRIPNSVHAMGGSVSHEPLGPISRVVSLATNFIEADKEMQKMNIMRKYQAALVQAFSPAFFQETKEALDLLIGNDANMKYNWEKFLGSEISGEFIPRGVADLAAAADVDPANHSHALVRRPGGDDFLDGVGSYIQRDIPGLREKLPLARSGLGKLPYKDRLPGEGLISPFQRTLDAPGYETEAELDRIEAPPQGAPRHVEVPTEFGKVRVALTEEERDKILKGGKLAGEVLKDLMSDPGWKSMPAGMKKQIAMKVFGKVRKASEGALMPTLQERAAGLVKEGLPQQEP